MCDLHYPAPVRVTDTDTDAIVALLEKHVEGQLKPEDIRSFFDARKTAQFPSKPVHPKVQLYRYGHWGDTTGLEIFAHQTSSRFNIHAVSGSSFMIAAPAFKGAVWGDYDPASGAVEFTALGMMDNSFAGFAYRPGPLAKEAIEHQITHHVTGACTHDHSALLLGPK